jgi:hypothetical protein
MNVRNWKYHSTDGAGFWSWVCMFLWSCLVRRSRNRLGWSRKFINCFIQSISRFQGASGMILDSFQCCVKTLLNKPQKGPIKAQLFKKRKIRKSSGVKNENQTEAGLTERTCEIDLCWSRVSFHFNSHSHKKIQIIIRKRELTFNLLIN